MAPIGKRRCQASKTHATSASTLNMLQTDKANNSAESWSSFSEALRHISFEEMFENSRGDPKPVDDAEKLMAEWNGFVACQLEDFVLEKLFDIVVKAIRQIVACGYSEKDAELAVLKSGLYYGTMNPVLNIVNGALIFLEMTKDFGTSKYRIFENLGNLVEYLLLEMVCILKEVRPSLTVAEAMSALKVSKMDLTEAFKVDGGAMRSYCTVGRELCESLFSYIKNAQPSASSAQREPERDLPKGDSPSKHFPGIGEMFFIKEQDGVGSKRDMLRQKPSHLERHDKGYLSKTKIKTSITPWGHLVLDKRLKDLNSVNSNTKRTCSESSVAGNNLPAATLHETGYTASPEDIQISSSPYDKSLGKYVPRDEKDKTIQSLASRLLMLKKEHQGLTDWVNENIMQAAQRLRKDQAELKALRQEKEAVEKSGKGKKYVREEDAIKRISEIEYDLATSANHMKVVSSTTSKLEDVNCVLKKELEALKLQALESAENLQEALMKEQEALERAQSWERKISLLQEGLSADKGKVAELQTALEKAKRQYSQIQALCKEEEKEKEKLVAKARSIARERERRESLAKKQEHSIRLNAETELQKGKVHMELLESKLLLESSKLSQVRRRVKGRSGNERMEWECVMCMSEEKSVVFLPCAHQSLCEGCNRLHEKQGLKDCPSCRTPIQRRITVQFADP